MLPRAAEPGCLSYRFEIPIFSAFGIAAIGTFWTIDLATAQPDTSERLKRFASEFHSDLEHLLRPAETIPPRLRDAVAYALLGPGKRLRAYLVYRCCALVGGDAADAFVPAAAMEMVHAFSLVHDDLPAMDDDDLRRGRPTCHKQFDEATAILAGDALLALAFELLATRVADPARAVHMTAELAQATGWRGMIGGQAADLAGEHEAPDLERVQQIHAHKTGALMQAACRLGGIAGGADAAALERLGAYGRHLGLAFQIADDLLDVTSTAAELGKGVAKDAARRKQTYPACVGIEQARQAGAAAVAEARAALAAFGSDADDLCHLAAFVMSRRA